ncbi:MAG: aldehyde ferredoxin oxidoreductase family protein [Candidatus Asgardarchaeia archaeon]
MNEKDPLSRVLYIDLSSHRFWVKDRKDLFEKYIGGVGVAINLLLEECPEGIDPFDPRNPIIFAVGPFNAVYPTASKTAAMFKSPLTGNLGESHAGGRSAIAIRTAGYGAIVIKGRSDTPMYLHIDENGVEFKNASTLWGMESSYTVGRIVREIEPRSGLRTIMRIGKAGEKLVRYASVITETYRHFGRLGLGAVFGSKKLKAIVITGKKSIPVVDKKEYKMIYNELYDKLTKSPAMKKYHEIGTPINVLHLNEIGALPVKNVTYNKYEDAEYLSGEYIAKNYLARRVSCAHCPVACIHVAAIRIPYKSEPYFYSTVFVQYDYEPIYALGTMLGGKDTEGLLRIFDAVDTYGLDAMSTGVVLAWATEAFEKGLINKEDTLGMVPKWGDYETYIEMVRHIAYRSNEFYSKLADGVEEASSTYGGKEFAMAFGGNEMPGYHTGPACYVGYMIGARHSHLDNAGYSYDQKHIGENPDAEKIVDTLMREEQWRQVLTSLHICLFARGVYTPEVVSRAFKPLGYEFAESDLMEIGKEIYKLKYKFKFREGFDLSKLRLPKRIFKTETPYGKISESLLKEALEIFSERIRSLI